MVLALLNQSVFFWGGKMVTSQLKHSLSDRVVVVVEDDPASRAVIVQTLERCGATVYAGANGHIGYELIQQHRPQFVITDIDMPLCNGWEMLRLVREDSAIANTPVIVLSAHFSPDDHTRAADARLCAHMTKPILPSRFILEVLEALNIKISRAG